MCLSRLKPHQFYPRHGILEWNQEEYELYILIRNVLSRRNRLILSYFEISYGIEQYYCMNFYDKIIY